MQSPISLAQLTALPLSPPELLRLAARTGYAFVGLRLTEVTPGGPYWPLHRDPALLRATKQAMAETGVGVLDIEIARIAADTAADAYDGEFAVAAELGARHVLTHGLDPDPVRRAQTFAAVCDRAAGFGLTCDVESVSWLEVGDYQAAAAMVRDAARVNAGLMIDSLHFFRSGGRPSDLASAPAGAFRYMQLADAPGETPTTVEGLIHTAREARLDPGEGDLDLVGLLSALPPGIPIALEIPNARQVEALGYEGHARKILEATLRLLSRL